MFCHMDLISGSGGQHHREQDQPHQQQVVPVHGLHLLGGLIVGGRTVVRMGRPDVEVIDLRLSVELCTVYWHYLLLVWLVLFAVMLST